MSLETLLLQFGVPPRFARAAVAKIGQGTEGAVFELPRGRVLKVNVTSTGQHITRLARRIKGRAWANQIHAKGVLHPAGLTPRGFWYVSDRLYPLEAREARILNAAGFALMANAKGQMSATAANAKWRQALSLLGRPLQDTLRKARAAGYHDLHGGNVMRTATGACKVIDIESLRPLKRKP